VPDVLVLKAADLLQLRLEIVQARGNANSFFSGIDSSVLRIGLFRDRTVQGLDCSVFRDRTVQCSGIGLFSVQV